MSSNLPLVRRSPRGRGGRKLEINIPQQQIHANSKEGLINKGGVMLSEYWPPSGIIIVQVMRQQQHGSSLSPAVTGLTITSRTNHCWLVTLKLLECLGDKQPLRQFYCNPHSPERSSLETKYESVHLSIQLI